MKYTPSSRSWLLLAIVSTLALTFALHGGALHVGFGRDDGYTLYNIVRMSPAAYLLDPATITAVAGSSLTPWGMLVFGVNTALFGLDPLWHHLHLLMVVWASAVATFLFLRSWVDAPAALAGALVFLCGTPVVFMSQEEMTAHYIYGLLFTVVSAHLFITAVRTGSRGRSALAAAFYLLACTCKEVFVPLPVVVLFMPVMDIRSRLRSSSGLWLVLLAYVGWRWAVFGPGLLGPRGVPIQPLEALRQIAGIPALLLGPAWPIFAALVAVAIWRKLLSLRLALFLLVLAFTLLAPLLPVTPGIGIREPGRLLLLPWWVIACMAVLGVYTLLPGQPAKVFALLAVAAATQVQASLPWRDVIARTKQEWAAWHQFVLTPSPSPKTLVLLEDNGYFWQKYHIDGMRMAARTLALPFDPNARVVNDRNDLADAMGNSPGGIFIYDAALQRLRTAVDANELKAWSDKLPGKRTGVYVFNGIPKMAFLEGGRLAAVRAEGKTVHISGSVPPSDIGQSFMLLAPESCSSGSMTRANTMSFEVAVDCATPESAQHVAARLCFVISNGGAGFVPAGQPNPECGRLTAR